MGRKEKHNASRLRQARRAHSTASLSAFAESIGYSVSYVSAVELGHLPETDDLVLAYEDRLNLPPGHLNLAMKTPATLLRHAAAKGAAGDVEIGLTREFPEGTLVACTLDECLRAGLSMVMRAKKGPIHLTSQAALDRSLQNAEFRMLWSTVISAALERGVDVHQYVLSTDDRQHWLRLVQLMLPLMGHPGEFQVRVVPAIRAQALQEVIVVPEVGAMMIMAPPQGSPAAAMAIEDQAQIALVSRYCEMLAVETEPCMDAISAIIEFERFQEAAEKLPSDRFLMSSRLTSMFVPTSWYEDGSPWARRLGLSAEERAEILTLRRSRLQAMQSNLEVFSYRDVCPVNAITHLVETGRWPDRSVLPGFIHSYSLSREEVAELLQNHLSFLRRFDNYELALVEDENLWLLHHDEESSMLFWSTRPGHVAVMERWPAAEGATVPLYVTVTQSQVSAALGDYFRTIWSRIPVANRDKKTVISRIEALLETVKRSPDGQFAQ